LLFHHSSKYQWKGINRKQSTMWQHLSRLKASAFFSLQKFLVVMKHSNLYLGLVLPSGGWQSLIGTILLFFTLFYLQGELVFLVFYITNFLILSHPILSSGQCNTEENQKDIWWHFKQILFHFKTFFFFFWSKKLEPANQVIM
jgi:hypothetical protein